MEWHVLSTPPPISQPVFSITKKCSNAASTSICHSFEVCVSTHLITFFDHLPNHGVDDDNAICNYDNIHKDLILSPLCVWWLVDIPQIIAWGHICLNIVRLRPLKYNFYLYANIPLWLWEPDESHLLGHSSGWIEHTHVPHHPHRYYAVQLTKEKLKYKQSVMVSIVIVVWLFCHAS